MHVIQRLLLGMSALALTACSTAVVHVDQPHYLYPYKGTQRAVSEVGRSWSAPVIPGEVVVRAWDIPMCLVADTVLLPIDFAVYISH